MQANNWETDIDDKGAWRIIQAVISLAFEQASARTTRNRKGILQTVRTDPEKVKAIGAWALRKPNKILWAYAEIGEHDYEKLVGLLVERCDRTLK